MTVTERIEKYMKERNWTVYRLGKESGLSQSTLAHVFRKDSEPTISTLETICKAFGVTLAQFFSDGAPVALTPDQEEILSDYSSLSEDRKSLVKNLIKNLK